MPSAANWIPSPTPDRLLTNPLGEGVVVDLANISPTILSPAILSRPILSLSILVFCGRRIIRRRIIRRRVILPCVAVEAPTTAMAILRHLAGVDLLAITGSQLLVLLGADLERIRCILR